MHQIPFSLGFRPRAPPDSLAVFNGLKLISKGREGKREGMKRGGDGKRRKWRGGEDGREGEGEVGEKCEA